MENVVAAFFLPIYQIGGGIEVELKPGCAAIDRDAWSSLCNPIASLCPRRLQPDVVGISLLDPQPRNDFPLALALAQRSEGLRGKSIRATAAKRSRQAACGPREAAAA